MTAGTWELAQCSHREVETLAAALGVDDVTAAVLVQATRHRPGRGVHGHANGLSQHHAGIGAEPAGDVERQHLAVGAV